MHIQFRLSRVTRNHNWIFSSILFTCLLTLALCTCKSDKNWSTYRHDSQRGAASEARISLPLNLSWVYRPLHSPNPAWMKPAEELPRMHVDNAYHVSIAQNRVYFGETDNNKIHALDLDSGEEIWRFFAEGPVRYTPTVWDDRIYFGSDDGVVYCLAANDGSLRWKYRPAPGAKKVLGNGRMISLWPIRTNVMVEDGIAYFGAGVFPYEGLYVCALNAEDGQVIWKNDTVGDLSHELQFGGITPQGYLMATPNHLYIQSGRAMPAVFDRQSGQFLNFFTPGSKVGGGWGLVADNEIIVGVDRSGTPAKVAYNEQTSERRDDAFASFDGIDMVLDSDIAYILTRDGIYCIDRAKYSSSRENIIRIDDQLTKMPGLIKDLRKKIERESQNTYSDIQLQLERIIHRRDSLLANMGNLRNSTIIWRFEQDKLRALIRAGNVIFTGGEKSVFGLDAKSGKQLWNSEIPSNVIGLAAVKDHLIASTDAGPIYCFSAQASEPIKKNQPAINPSPYPEDDLTAIYQRAATEILRSTQITHGYCLVLGAGTGRLAFELARQTDLKIIGIESDRAEIDSAKIRLDRAGLYGKRIVIENWELAELPDYFANLIVSDDILHSGNVSEADDEISRILKPCGGIAFLGQPQMPEKAPAESMQEKLDRMFPATGMVSREVIREGGYWLKLTRPPLPGAGGWTHQYANSQNTLCSDDAIVACPLGVLWYGEPGPSQIVERHAKSAAPVAMDGRLFVQGEEVVMAYDSYNGTFLWKRDIPGAVRVRADVDGGNLALSSKGLFVAANDQCLRLDPATGETLRAYHLPRSLDAQPRRWGYIACIGNTLFGSTATPMNQAYNALWKESATDSGWKSKDDIPPEHISGYEFFVENRLPKPDTQADWSFQQDGTKWRFITDFPDWSVGIKGQLPPSDRMLASDAIFAMDIDTGRLRWIHRAKRIANIAISIGDNTVFFAENGISEIQKKQALREKINLARTGKWEEIGETIRDRASDVRLAVALDANTGNKLWQKPIDLTGCGGDAVALAYQNKVLLFFGSYGLHDKWRFPAGQLTWHRVTALSTENQSVLWSRPLNYMTRPLVIDNTVIVEPRACDLFTGKTKMRAHPITGQTVPWEFYRPGHTCAGTAANRNGLFYRSYNAAFYDLKRDQGLTYFGAIRPGCWINMIPANGLLLFPESSSGCTCSFPLRSTVVLKPGIAEKTEEWTVYITHGAMTPVKHLGINLGAPGDRKDSHGTLWLGYPRPDANYGVKFDLNESIADGMGYFSGDARSSEPDGLIPPWITRSGCLGLRKLELPLIDDAWGERSGRYTLKLGFAAPAGDRPGCRVFDIKIQDKVMLEDFDLLADPEIVNRTLVKSFNNISVTNKLTIELIPAEDHPNALESPLLNFIEAIREDEIDLSESPANIKRLSRNEADLLLTDAHVALEKNEPAEALEMYHRVLDAAPEVSQKISALDGMAAIGSPKSLPQIAPYCKDPSPVLWEYRGPEQELVNGVNRVNIAVANNLAGADPEKATSMLHRALNLASNLTIRHEAASSLEKLGCPIDAGIREQGFITRWHLVGPFPWNEKQHPLDDIYINEPEVDLSASYQLDNKTLVWQPFISEQPMINLIKQLSLDDHVAAYAYATIEMPREQDLYLKIGTNDGFKCWFNGEVIGRFDGGRGWEVDQDIFKVVGKSGINTILLKISQLGGGWGFSVRATDLDNQSIVTARDLRANLQARR